MRDTATAGYERKLTVQVGTAVKASRWSYRTLLRLQNSHPVRIVEA